MREKHENPLGERYYYCFVDFQNSPEVLPLVYIIPAEIVAMVIKSAHQHWLNAPGKNGHKRKDGPLRRLLPDYKELQIGGIKYSAGWLSKYKNAWNQLNLDTADPEKLFPEVAETIPMDNEAD